VGILEDVSQAMTFHFHAPGRDMLLLSGVAGSDSAKAETEFGSSEYAKEVLGQIWGTPPALDLKQEAALQKCLRELVGSRAIESAHDCSDGGLAVALAEAGFIKAQPGASYGILFAETAGRVLLSCDPKGTSDIQQIAVRWGVRADRIGRTVPEKLVIRIDGKPAVSANVSELRQVWDSALKQALHAETPEHLVPEVLQKS
jgi:phosphoribosylformylglycinamidine (FGAM) synthase-like enzyme